MKITSQVIAVIAFTLLMGCSADGFSTSSPQIQIKRDDRSESERYQTCLSRSVNRANDAERSRCRKQARYPYPSISLIFPGSP